MSPFVFYKDNYNSFQKTIFELTVGSPWLYKSMCKRADVWNYISKYGSWLGEVTDMVWNKPTVFIMQIAILITHRKIHRLYLQNTIITITFQFTFSHLFLITWYQLSICSYLYWCHKVSSFCRNPTVDTMQKPLRVFPEAHCEDSLTSFGANIHSNLNRHSAQLGADLQAHWVDAKALSASKTVMEEPSGRKH